MLLPPTPMSPPTRLALWSDSRAAGTLRTPTTRSRKPGANRSNTLLTLSAMVAGVFGGMLVSWMTLDISPNFFLTRLNDTIDLKHFLVGMSKAPVFGLVIAIVGCRHGLQVGGDVESLGKRVTTSVVQAIFAVIVIDALFAMMYLELDI